LANPFEGIWLSDQTQALVIAEDHVLTCILHGRETATFHLTLEHIAPDEALDITDLTTDDPASTGRLG
jgi:hypothetical protein